MANSNAAGLSLADVRDSVNESVKRVQSEGEKLVIRFRREARELVESAPRPAVPQAVVDLRRQAQQVLRDVEDRRDRLVESLRARIRMLGDTVVKQLGVADAGRVAELSREVTGLSLRLAEMERRLQALAKKSEKKEKVA